MPKRTNGEGTIYQDKNGLWRGELTLGYENGKRIKRKFSSMRLDELQKKMNEERVRLNRNIITQNSDFTLKEWLEFWLQTYKLNSVKPRTYDYYEYALESYVYPYIGDIRLDKLKSIQIQQLYNGMNARGLSTSTIKSVHIPLNQAFEQAINNELVYKNPCRGTSIPKKEARKSRALTVGEQQIFEEACTQTTFHDFFIFLLNTGLRCGEGIALAWDDIDMQAKTLTVNKNITTIVNRDDASSAKHVRIVQTTKTESGRREIPLSKECFRVLSRRPNRHGFVFASRVGTPLGHRNVTRAFDNLLEATDLPSDLTIHSLRHSFATRLLERGANIKALSELLGHKSIQITLDIYGHAFKELRAETISLLDSAT